MGNGVMAIGPQLPRPSSTLPWREVLEYFDAFIVGLTATPSLHTMGFFGSNLVAQYPYEQVAASSGSETTRGYVME